MVLNEFDYNYMEKLLSYFENWKTPVAASDELTSTH